MRLFLVVAAFLNFAFLTAASGEERIALVVANSSFAGAPDLSNAQASAERIAASLDSIGFDVDLVTDAGREDVARAMSEFAAALKDSSTVGLFYFVGYGIQADGLNYLLPRDARIGSAKGAVETGLSLSGFLAELDAMPASKVIVIDAAWDYPATTLPPDSAKGLATVKPGTNMIVAFSAAPGKIARNEAGPATAFAEALAQELPVTEADIEPTLRKVRDAVVAATGGTQVPWMVSSLSGSIRFAAEPGSLLPAAPVDPSAAPDDPAAAEARMWNEIKDSGDPELFRKFVSTYPQSAFAPLALYVITEIESTGTLGGGLIGDLKPRPGPGQPTNYEPVAPGPGGSVYPGVDAYPPSEPIPMDVAPGGSGSGGSDYSMPEPGIDLYTGIDSPGASGSAVDGSGMASEAERLRHEEEMARRLHEEELARQRYEEAARAEQARMEEALRAEAERQAAEEQALGSAEPAPPSPPPPVDGGETIAAAPLPVEAPPAAEAPAPSVEEASVPPEPAAPADPAASAETRITRHPTLDAADSVVVAEVFTVSVALTQEQMTPDVTVSAGPTTAVTAEGALEFPMPADAEEWPIDIDLLAAGFDLADGGKWSRRVTLYKSGDSDYVHFEIKARTIPEDSKKRQLMARFYHAGRFLGSVSRPVTVLRETPASVASDVQAAGLMSAVAPPQEVLTSTLAIGDEIEVPDLDVTVYYDDPDHLGGGTIFIHSPHIAGPVIDKFTTPAGMTDWLNSEYRRLVKLGLDLRGAEPLYETAGQDPAPQDPAAQKRFIAKVAEGFGDDLYRNYVPQPFKDVFWSLRQRDLIHSIQITSNSPVLPWELVRPRVAEGAAPDGFLGISYRLARWAPRAAVSQVDQPLNRMPFTGVATVAPPYENNLELPFQQAEIDALSKLAGFRLIGGDFSAFEKMVGEVSTGFIHFSGHGEINDPGTGAPVFAIRLTDQLLDPTTWRALTFAPRDQGNPFYFFNACDTGQAASLGGFVQGWGPAILASGASGFIGGMWPLTDRTAASFSTEFYSGVTGHLADGPVYLAEVLQGVRKRFYETGDPTYLAYTFYGNANLQGVAQ